MYEHINADDLNYFSQTGKFHKMVYLELSLFLFLNKNNIINAPLPLYVLVHELRAHVCVRVRMCMCMHMWRRGGGRSKRDVFKLNRNPR